MKKITLIFLLNVLSFTIINAQSQTSVQGIILDSETQIPLSNVRITIVESNISQRTNALGNFILTNLPLGNQLIEISLNTYETQRFPILIEVDKPIDLGILLLVFDLSNLEENSGLISLTEDDLNNDDFQSENTAGLLQSSRDVFQNRAAFDFGQAFFRVRGYDSQSAQVLINGVSMNKIFNGRPQWNNWGGLNDVTRNQELTMGLSPSSYSFGDVLGTTNIFYKSFKVQAWYTHFKFFFKQNIYR
jgi:hypothetical protein